MCKYKEKLLILEENNAHFDHDQNVTNKEEKLCLIVV